MRHTSMKGMITDMARRGLAGDLKGQGTPGLSAYEIWLAEGNTGTVTDFIASLAGTPGLSAYEVWLAQGNTGTAGDFLASLAGEPGTDGASVEIQVTAEYIQWRAVGAATWNNLIALSAITGQPGSTGPSIEMQTSATAIQWRVAGTSVWNDLIALSEIAGAPGASSDTTPIGDVRLWPLDTLPDANHLWAYGGTASRTLYPELFERYGTTFGEGDGSTTFGLPDMRGVFPVGKDTSQTEFNTLYKKGGGKTHRHIYKIATRAYWGVAGSDGGIQNAGAYKYSNDTWAGITTNDGSAPNTQVNSALANSMSASQAIGRYISQGDTDLSSSLPPYAVVNWVIKAKHTVPITSTVEDRADSTSTTNALSANQGRLLREDIDRSLVYKGELAADADYNTLTGTGIYFIGDETGHTHGPGFGWGTLTVINNTAYTKQEAWLYDGSIHVERYCNDAGVWTAWVSVKTASVPYEAGTFTPTFYGTSTAGSFTYSFREGHYTRIGNRVMIDISLGIASVSVAASGWAEISGLPFTSKSTGVYRAIGHALTQGMAWGGASTQVNVGIDNGRSFIHIYGTSNNSGPGGADAASFGANDFILISLSYEIN